MVSVVVVLLLSGAVAACSRKPATTKIGAGGGTVVSPDKAVTAVFAPGEADNGTEARIRTGVADAPPPTPMMEPVDLPFDVVAEKGKLHKGTITVALGTLPDPADGGPV